MTAEVRDWVLYRNDVEQKDRDYRADVRMFLKRYVIGEDFDDDVKLKQLKPPSDGLYAFRVVFNPHHRILGGFVRPGEFVATAQKARSLLEQEGRGWTPTRTSAKTQWEALLPNHSRLTSTRSSLLVDFIP
jgi:hypothetical protein